MRAPLHPLQRERLAALRSYSILDTPRESDFDEVVEVVARICEAPIAVVNLIDENRQWFKAEVGLGVRETPLESSICSHVILQPGITVISDTLGDARFLDNPLCIGAPNLRFYAGMCLQTEDGLPIGTLCVLDYEPRDLTLDQRRLLQVMGRQVMRQIELRSALNQSQLMRQEVDHRVKNSLAILQSLLQWQARESHSAETAQVLSDVRGRIDAIGLVHDQLHRTAQVAQVNLAHFIDAMRNALSSSIGGHAIITAAVPPVTVRTDDAINIGILINELVANAVKHGAGLERPGKAHISVERQGNRLNISVTDDGPGLPETFDPGSGRGLGMRISLALAKQLGDGLRWRTDGAGTRFEFTAPVES
jgi:two-component sensor histidine kinase